MTSDRVKGSQLSIKMYVQESRKLRGNLGLVSKNKVEKVLSHSQVEGILRSEDVGGDIDG